MSTHTNDGRGATDRDQRSQPRPEVPERENDEVGFTLIELLLVIVVAGILAAVAIIGIGGVTGTAKTAGCAQTFDAANAAVAAYFGGHASTYPTTFGQMITA